MLGTLTFGENTFSGFFSGGDPMLDADELVGLITRGWHVHVARQGEDRVVKLTRRGAGGRREQVLDPATYDQLMTEAMGLLADGHGTRHRVHVNMDFYGNVRAEVRSGLFGRQSSELRISPRHISLLEQLISERSRATDVT